MFKSFRLITLLLLILIVFIAQASFSLPLPSIEKTQSSEVIESKVNIPMCYMETADGVILDLSNLCRQQFTDLDTRSTPPSPSLYNNSMINKFDDELYGKENRSIK